MMRLALYVLGALLFIVASLPAALVDVALRDASDNRLRLASAVGSLWDGGGVLASGVQTAHTPWAEVAWRFDIAALLHARIAWQLALDGRPAARIALGPRGLHLGRIDLDLPLAPIARAVPHPLAQAGWSGRVRARSEAIDCMPDRRCSGALALRLDGLRADILPGGPLGSYRATLGTSDKRMTAELASDAGNRLRVDGTLHLDGTGTPAAALELSGDDALMRVLPGVLHGVAGPLRDGVLRVDWPPR